MLNIAITAGGTSEDIDGVRKLTNVSTGNLGWHCLEAALNYLLEKNRTDFRIYYILTDTAFRKELSAEQRSYVDFIAVTDAESVYNTVNNLTSTVNITHFIHSMAISDFTFSYAVSAKGLAKEIQTYIEQNGNSDAKAIEQIILSPQSRYSENRKISSEHSLILGLRTTQKVISLIKKNNPDTVLVGFKLLRNVDKQGLINEAKKLSDKNGCDWVFANELGSISGSAHTGLLISGSKIVAAPTGKEQIAETIIDAILHLNN